MDDRRPMRTLQLGLIVVVLVLVATAAVGYRNIEALYQARLRATAVRLTVDTVGILQLHLAQAESARQRHLLTDDPESLRAYQSRQALLDVDLQRIAASNTEGRISRTDLAELQTLLADWRNPAQDPQGSLKAIESLCARLHDESAAVLAGRRDASERYYRWARMSCVIFGLSALIVVFAFWRVLLRQAAQRAVLSQQLATLNRKLITQVVERTADRDRMWQLSTDVMVIFEKDGTVAAINPAWNRELGYDLDEVIGRSLYALIHPGDLDRLHAGVGSLGAEVSFARCEARLRAQDGSWRWIAWSMVPSDRNVSAVGRDFTAEKLSADALSESQAALRQSQKMEAVGQLTGGLAHDFNNILAGISGSLEVLSLRLKQGRTTMLDGYLRSAMDSVRRAAAVTHRLLAFSRRQTLNPSSLDINHLIDDLNDLVRRTAGPVVAVEFVLKPGLWPVLIDGHQLENALVNLCINARDAMPEGGQLIVRTGNITLQDAEAAELSLPAGDYVLLSVADSGVGMSEDVIAHAFEPFFTTKPTGMGTGLGLSMTYGFVHQSGGQIRILSEPGRGTTVLIYLPRSLRLSAEAPQPALASRMTSTDPTGKSILVVEDDAAIRAVIVEILTDLHYRVLEAADANAGLELLRSVQPLDLLITDVGLPGGINGRQLADAGMQLRPDLRVLIVTGYAAHMVAQNEPLESTMQLLTKPFSLDALIDKIDGIFAASRPAAAVTATRNES